jgi:hypothetical protein
MCITMALAPRGLLGIVSSFISPRQFIEGRLVASFPIAILWLVKLLVLVIFDAGAVLVAPAVPFSIDATRFHKGSFSLMRRVQLAFRLTRVLPT